MRSATALLALVLVATACGDDASGDPAVAITTTAGAATSSTTDSDPVDPAPSATTTTPSGGGETTTTSTPQGPAAPDFTLALGEGGTFTLSDEQKPVYMVFWAEW